MDRKVALVTGASGGIGRSICEKLASLNMDIVINYRSDKEGAEEVEKICQEQGVKTLLVQADVADEDQVKKLFKETMDEFGRVDVLVNNAGITRDNLIMRMKAEDFQDVIDINLLSAFHMIKAGSRIMMRQRAGSIINMSSVVGIRGNAGQVNYSASKAGLIGMTKSMAKELASRGIRVNAVAPGFIDTEMTQALGDKAKEAILETIPLNHLGEVEDVANLVAFLASEESGYITGQVISVDGGMNI